MQYDSFEKSIYAIGPAAAEILLKDRTMNKNIIWANGKNPELKIDQTNWRKIKFRYQKTNMDKSERTRSKAEVFTPIKIINKMVSLVDNEIKKECKNIQEYVSKTWLEITCGEGHFLTSRYNPKNGQYIKIGDRVGTLDRKLMAINKNTQGPNEWYKYTLEAYKSIYGYEYQGDSLLISRVSLMLTFIENMQYKWSKTPTTNQLTDIADIISWNIWQMDGLTHTIPHRKAKASQQLTLFSNEIEYKPVAATIINWDTNEIIKFKDLLKGV